jgi:hypothetical protein
MNVTLSAASAADENQAVASTAAARRVTRDFASFIGMTHLVNG